MPINIQKSRKTGRLNKRPDLHESDIGAIILPRKINDAEFSIRLENTRDLLEYFYAQVLLKLVQSKRYHNDIEILIRELQRAGRHIADFKIGQVFLSDLFAGNGQHVVRNINAEHPVVWMLRSHNHGTGRCSHAHIQNGLRGRADGIQQT